MTTRLPLTIALHRPEQLFTAEPIEPWSPDYTEFTVQPAMDTVRDRVLARLPRKTTEIELQLILPVDQVRPGLDEELTTAVRRWVTVQNELDVEVKQGNGAIGRRLFVFGLIAFMLLQSFSYWTRRLAENAGDLALYAVAEALIVISWVMLWFPVQMFTMEAWRSAIRRRRMRVLERMQVRVTTADGPTRPSS